MRERALELEVLLARLPDDRAALGAEVEAAERARSECERSVQQAADELRTAETDGNGERLAAARRFDVRARDRLRMAERRAGEAHGRTEELEARAVAADREAGELEGHARDLAGALSERPRLAAEAGAAPGAGLEGVAEWGTRARAALMVARSQLAAERDGLIRQASELGELVLGEPLAAATPGVVAKRLEEKRDSPSA